MRQTYATAVTMASLSRKSKLHYPSLAQMLTDRMAFGPRPSAHIYHRTSNLYQDASPFSNPFSLVMVGGGPRGALCFNALIATLMSHQGDVTTLQQMGAHYDIKVSLIEGQERNQLARGNSFGINHTGICNTGINWQLKPRLAPSADTNLERVISMGNIANKVRLSVDNFEETEKRIKETNRMAAILFKAATSAASTTPNQVLAMDSVCLMRQDVGESLLKTFKELYMAAKHELPYLSLNVQANTRVRGIKIGRDNTSMSVNTHNKETGRRSSVQADTVHLFTGTTLKVPEMKPAVKSLTYCGVMTPHTVRGFFANQNLIQESKLKVGAKVLIGGTSLSAIDAMMAMEPFMGLVEECSSEPGGYRINSTAAKDYAGAVTFVSNEKCRFANPRVSLGEGWRQKHDAFGSSQHLHALFLHEFGQDLCNIWTVIQKAGIARTNGILPSQVFPEYKTTKEQLAHMYQSSLTFFKNMELAGGAELSSGPNSTEKEEYLDKATHSLYGARMQAAMNRKEGYGMERDLDEVRKNMAKLAPLTWGGRHGWEMEKAQLAAITSPVFASQTSNEKQYKDWICQDWDITGSPAAMHSFIVKLSESGVVDFVTSKYADIAVDPSGEKLCLQGETYDAFLVSPVFNRDIDETVEALERQVTPVHPSLASHAKVGKHRALMSKSGKLLNLEDYGLSGCGAKIQHKDGSCSHLNAFAGDVNSLSSAIDTMPSVAMRMAAAVHLSAAGIDDPWCVLRRLFEECKPSLSDYEDEVANFAPFFKEAHELALFYNLVERTSHGVAKAFGEGYDMSVSKFSRQVYLEKVKTSSNRVDQEALQEYDQQIVDIPTFNPASRNDYFARFSDTTKEEDIHVYQRAFEMAKNRLHDTKTAESIDEGWIPSKKCSQASAH